jgi:hypothetical protein
LPEVENGLDFLSFFWRIAMLRTGVLAFLLTLGIGPMPFCQADILYVGESIFPDLDNDGFTWATRDLSDIDLVVRPSASDSDDDGFPNSIDPSPSNPGVPARIADMGLNTGGPYVIAPASSLALAFSIATSSYRESIIAYDFNQNGVVDAYSDLSNLTIDHAHLVALGMASPGVHQFDVAAFGLGVTGTSTSGFLNLNSVVRHTVSFEVTAIPESGVAPLCSLLTMGFAMLRHRTSRRA